MRARQVCGDSVWRLHDYQIPTREGAQEHQIARSDAAEVADGGRQRQFLSGAHDVRTVWRWRDDHGGVHHVNVQGEAGCPAQGRSSGRR
ncbi:hypothetical protein [Micromonospora sp. 067-2]|uniref:hypothetical protein n=1 Tax=Micromonospora sp. 067-2 TaxID=2789270 RepID=UPI00397D4259